jgi:hypothetical protein
LYRQALALAEPRGMRPLIAHCHLAKLYCRADTGGQAQEHLTIAATKYREMEMIGWNKRRPKWISSDRQRSTTAVRGCPLSTSRPRG